ncbi:MAG: DUF418 domain-containing protein [Cyclobacteriaceae bacterium]|nr:DUF418 domain-containing protein [Cyclobacteriaceae bacterium]
MQASTQSRIEVIDVLRGFTLIGIAIIHFADQYYAGAHPQSHNNFNIKFLGDEIVMGFIGILISGKFFLIFSFLFGLSFSIQLNKSKGDLPFVLRFLWRLIILLLIGLIHHLHYRGDILTIYAMLGVGLLLCFRLPDKVLIILALALTLNLPSVAVRGWQATQQPATSVEAMFTGADEQNENYYNTVKSGEYKNVLIANFHELDYKYQFQVDSGRIYITMGLFLLGLYAGRKQFFENLEQNLPYVRKNLLKRSLWIMLTLILAAVIFFGGAELLKLPLPELIQWAIGGLLFDTFNLALASIYVAAVILLFQKEKWHARLMKLYAPGRMGLTTYLVQGLVGTLLFFGFGFGLLGEIGALTSAGLGLLLFILQSYFSSWWLARFKYGPAEWAWRSLTYLKFQPLRN